MGSRKKKKAAPGNPACGGILKNRIKAEAGIFPPLLFGSDRSGSVQSRLRYRFSIKLRILYSPMAMKQRNTMLMITQEILNTREP